MQILNIFLSNLFWDLRCFQGICFEGKTDPPAIPKIFFQSQWSTFKKKQIPVSIPINITKLGQYSERISSKGIPIPKTDPPDRVLIWNEREQFPEQIS